MSKEIELPTELQNMLDGLGNSPLKEKKLFEILKSTTKGSLIFNAINKDDKVDINKYEPMVFAEFISRVADKILNVKNDDGTYKSTKATENMELPNITQREDIFEEMEEIASLYHSDEKIKALEKLEELNKKCIEISGVKKEKLTDWEKTLIVEQIKNASNEYQDTITGKQ